MSKAFEEIAAGLTDAIAIAKGEKKPARIYAPADNDALRIRRQLGLTREQFADRFGLPLGTVRDWEQNRRMPDASARTLLAIIAHEPQAASRAVRMAKAKPTTRKSEQSRWGGHGRLQRRTRAGGP
jgi:putative transcriptional regulator